MTIGLTRRQFAAAIGCSLGYAQKLVDTGRCVLTADGKIDCEASKARIAATADPGRRDVAARHAIARGREVGSPAKTAESAESDMPIDADPDLGGAPSTGRAKVKALLMRFENDQIKIEMALRRGLRFERAAIKREAAGLGALLRAGMERVIDQTAPRLAAAQNELQRRQIIDAEIRRLRLVVKREMPRAMRRMRSVSGSARD